MYFTKNLFLAVTAVSTAFLFGCKKETVQKPVEATSTVTAINPSVYKFKETVSVYAADVTQGYLNLTVSSDDKAFLADYISSLNNSKIALVAGSVQEQTPEVPQEEAQTGQKAIQAVAVDFDWSHFKFNTEKGKLYQVKFMPKDASKALVMVGGAMANVSSFTSTTGYACVNIYNTHKFWLLECLCTKTDDTGAWSLKNGSNSFYGVTLDYADNMEVRTFRSNEPFLTYGSFMSGSQKIYYRPRLNYSSIGLPSDYQDANGITLGSSIDPYRAGPAPATLTFYIAG